MTPQMHARVGVGLIEVIVAMVLVGIAVVALAAASLYAQQSLNRAARLENAARAAASVIDSLLAENEPGDGARTVNGVSIRWSVTSGEPLQIRTTVQVTSAPGDTLTFDASRMQVAP